MKMVRGWVETRMVGSRCEFEFEVEDDATDEEIDEYARDVMFDCVEWSFEVD